MSGPRILTIDLERVPGLAEFWQPKTHYINTNSIVSYPRTICYAYKWNDSPKIHFEAEWLTSHEEMIRAVFALYDEADAVVTYNGRSFDSRHFASDWAVYDMGVPSPWKEIDLFLAVKKHFGFEVKSLDEVTKRLGLQSKVDKYDPKVAKAAVAGDVKAQRKIARYNKGDVKITDALHERLRPHLTTVNMALFSSSEETVCQKCGSLDLERRGYAYTDQSKFQQYRCRTCGGWTRDTKSVTRVYSRASV